MKFAQAKNKEPKPEESADQQKLLNEIMKSLHFYFDRENSTQRVREKLTSVISGNSERTSLLLNGNNAAALSKSVNELSGGSLMASTQKEGSLWRIKIWRAPESQMPELAIISPAPRPMHFDNLMKSSKIIPSLASVQPKKTAVLNSPSYLECIGWELMYQKTEAVVFKELDSVVSARSAFASKFNSLTDEQKREFLLFLRSEALDCNNIVKDMNRFAFYRETQKRVKSYLSGADLNSLMARFSKLEEAARKSADIFISKNPWLEKSLGSPEMQDLKAGLVYFFMENPMKKDEVMRKSEAFLELKPEIERMSSRIISRKVNPTRTLSTSANVSDSGIREIVASAFFSQVAYALDSRALLTIITIESNFEQARGGHGIGVTQQTTFAANTALHAKFVRDSLFKLSGITQERQMVSMLLLGQNTFLNVMEGAKTFSLKCGVVKISTGQVSRERSMLEKSSMVAYHYNGNVAPHPANPEMEVREAYRRRFKSIYSSKSFFPD